MNRNLSILSKYFTFVQILKSFAMSRKISVLLLLVVYTGFLSAQTQKSYSSAEIYKQIEKLNFLGNVLYVAAHPDDENTDMISFLSNHTNARVGYLSLNRGDGGQNLIGTEINELLGVIRTEELLAARKIDGGEQFFTRAIDFGFSKNPDETFSIWDKDVILGDVVWTFRKFRPDVVINRFNHRTSGDTHGHHTASAILSTEAYDLAQDKNAYPEQLKYHQVWKPNRLYFNDSWFFYGSKEKYLAADHEGSLEINTGRYLPVLGKSNTEISAVSRSQHKSQGFGSGGKRGEDLHFFEPIKGDVNNAEISIFEGIDTSWNRIKGGKKIGKILYQVQENFDLANPQKSIPKLLEAYQLIQKLEDEYWRDLKTEQIKEIIAASAGLFLEISTDLEYAVQNETIQIDLEAINRSKTNIVMENLNFSADSKSDLKYNVVLKFDTNFKKKIDLKISKDIKYTNPYWLDQPHSLGMYPVENVDVLGLPKTPAAITAVFKIKINDISLEFKRDLIHKRVEQIRGEIKEPFAILPEISVKMKDRVLVFADNSPREIEVEIKAFKENIDGNLFLEVADNWKVEPENLKLNFKKKNQSKTVKFKITPPENQSEIEILPKFKTEKNTFDKELHIIDYSHIPLNHILMPARTKANRIDIKIEGKNIAYIKGAGDEIPSGLREIGYQVDEILGENLNLQNLKKYDAIITGIRAYNVNDDLILNQDILFEYVKNGGTLVTQYSQLMGIKTEKVAPLDLTIGRERVTDENSPVRFLNPEHPVLNFPNKITQTDFESWVQERGLYFASDWSSEFTPILGMHDKGEEELRGSLLVAKYGKGHYVYTGLSFFRELPAGVPGAYRLFANILAL